MIDLMLGSLFRLILVVILAAVITAHFASVMSLLLGAVLLFAIARLLWPSPGR